MSYDNTEDLNYDFNYNMFLAKNLLKNLKHLEDRKTAVKWMRKLLTCTNSLSEMRLRNDFMYYLVINIQNFKLESPFNTDPPNKSLKQLRHLLPVATPDHGEDTKTKNSEQKDSPCDEQGRPFLYAHSPDGGAFLAAQPVPRCGAFCYLAVVSHTKQ